MNNSLQAVSSGQGKDVILLHGLFGQGSNLRGIARALEPHFRVHCLTCLTTDGHHGSPQRLWRHILMKC